MAMKLQIVATGYAAIVATGALALEIRRWFETGPRLVISIMPNAMTFGGGNADEELCAVTVTNRGRNATTITHLVLYEFPDWVQRLLPNWLQRLMPKWVRRIYKSPVKTYFVQNSHIRGQPPLPWEIGPNQQWFGGIHKNPTLIPDLQTGNFYVGVIASHSSRTKFKRIPKPRDPLPKGTQTLA
jgi:hypothetical protein